MPPALVLVAGAVLLVGFVLTQRHGRDPLLDRSALTHGRFLRANGVAFVNTATTSASGTLIALAKALTLTDGEDAWLLMTSRPTGDGEFACYHLEVKYGEFSDEHPSFVELVRSGARQIAEGRED